MSNNLAKSLSTVGGITLLSRILGFIRDVVTATVFGVSAGYDAFLIAFKIPNFLRALFAEGAFTQAFVPMLSEQVSQASPDEVQRFINLVFSSLLTVVGLFTLTLMLIAPWLVRLFVPGFELDGERYHLVVALLEITLPYLITITMTAFVAGVLNVYQRFAVPAFTPVLFNVSMITAALFLTSWLKIPIYALAWGVLAGGVLQFGFQLPFLAKIGRLPRLSFSLTDTRLHKLYHRMIPALFGVSVFQINLLITSLFASYLPVGSISWLYYAERLMQFPLGVFGVALATVVLPYLSSQYAEQSESAYSYALDWSLRCVLLIGTPAFIGLYILAGPLMTTLFRYGSFTMMDVANAMLALRVYALGIVAFMAIKILASAYYARQDIKTPVKMGVVALLVNTCLSYLLLEPFAHVGLAMATVIAAIVNACLLCCHLLWTGQYQVQLGWPIFLVRLLFASGLMAIYLWFMTQAWTVWAELAWYWRFSHLLGIVVSAMLLYFTGLWCIGLRLRHVRAPIMHRVSI